MFTTSTLLITGGTGSFGNAVLKRFLDSDIAEIRIFSRDEKKQDDMRKRYNSAKLKFYIGDVRDARSIEQAMRGVDRLDAVHLLQPDWLSRQQRAEPCPIGGHRSRCIADMVAEIPAIPRRGGDTAGTQGLQGTHAGRCRPVRDKAIRRHDQP